jgi:hypothetical protein
MTFLQRQREIEAPPWDPSMCPCLRMLTMVHRTRIPIYTGTDFHNKDQLNATVSRLKLSNYVRVDDVGPGLPNEPC